MRLQVSLVLFIGLANGWSWRSLPLRGQQPIAAVEQGNCKDSDIHECASRSEKLSNSYTNGFISRKHQLHPLSQLKNVMMDSLGVLQDHYFAVWLGTWPDTIDWTAAVIGTYVSATLSSFTSYKAQQDKIDDMLGDYSSRANESRLEENLIAEYFSQIVSFYFGQNAFALRTQAYDDMLWVVLGWLETINFVNRHSNLHFGSSIHHSLPDSGHCDRDSPQWFGKQFISSYSHRARIFYDLASKGWDSELCGGGMLWNPYLRPYKNAITNELFISASINMYLYFPGDENSSPFSLENHMPLTAKPHEKKFLQSAIEGYQWLSNSNMTNSHGLYVDGFHISNDGQGFNGQKECDERNEMVYTYNQGVILSGLRGLWESTGDVQYLVDAHDLVYSVIGATGWHLRSNSAPDNHVWAGLGRNGVLEDACDSGGYCSQDAQTFKGIYFHHLTNFCVPLPIHVFVPGVTVAADQKVFLFHQRRCKAYATWVSHNALAAYATRNENNEFGMWWGEHDRESKQHFVSTIPINASDYKNFGYGEDDRAGYLSSGTKILDKGLSDDRQDVNDRGRGRTVETQGGGLSVLRAMLEISGSSHL